MKLNETITTINYNYTDVYFCNFISIQVTFEHLYISNVKKCYPKIQILQKILFCAYSRR